VQSRRPTPRPRYRARPHVPRHCLGLAASAPIPSCPDSCSNQGAGSVDAQAQAASSARVLASGQHPRLLAYLKSIVPSEVRCFPLFLHFVASVVVTCEVQEITSLLSMLYSTLSDRDISLKIEPDDELNV
jgi:hypothetical protein